MQNHILSIILFTPLLGALVLLFVPKENKDAVRWIANIFALLGFLISLPLVPLFWDKRFEAGFKFIEGAPSNWIPSIGAGYFLGIDGISFLLIMSPQADGVAEYFRHSSMGQRFNTGA